ALGRNDPGANPGAVPPPDPVDPPVELPPVAPVSVACPDSRAAIPPPSPYARPTSPLCRLLIACWSGVEMAVSGGSAICPISPPPSWPWGAWRRGGSSRPVMPSSHWYELPRPPKLMGSTLLERRGSGVLRQPVDEYNTVELISMPAHPAGVGIQSG